MLNVHDYVILWFPLILSHLPSVPDSLCFLYSDKEDNNK